MRTCLLSCSLSLLVLAGCDCGGMTTGCGSDDECPAGQRCRDGVCEAPPAPDGGDRRDASCESPCGSACCASGELCLEGARCAEDLGPCASDADCANDSECHAASGRCVPIDGVRASCELALDPGVFRSSVECEWTGPAAGDPYPDHVHVESMPLVVDFAIDRGPDDPPRPSIVFVATDRFAYTDAGVIRIIDGATCAPIATLGDPDSQAAGTPAIGDLNGDGRGDVVAPVAGGGIAAWGYDDASASWTRLWRSADTSATAIHSLSIADLDDDGVPEIVAGAIVYGADGSLKSATLGNGELTCGSYAPPAVIADVDLDDRLELVQGQRVWQWDDAAGDLVAEDYWVGPGAPGFVAVADFGEFAGRAGDAPGRPEIAVVSRGTVRVMTIAGEVVFGPVALPGAGDGGNPTIADFDGDGVPEVGAGGPGSYSVFDLACADPAGPGECASGRSDGLLWTRPVQDTSCGINGSTVFDFEGDGRDEVVYSDECYVRVFDGRDGTVLWSHRRSSGTWIEAPVVADADGDFHAEIVSGSNSVSAPSCASSDASYAGLRCTADEDCPTEASRCVENLCRCASAADCGDPELDCTPPLEGSAGNVCRASWGVLRGVRVYSDVRDRWAASRPVWNQHAYSVTHVDEHGVVPRGSAMARNWESEDLNNFRQNVQGGVARSAGPDATVRGLGASGCSEGGTMMTLRARLCSRGHLGIGAGVDVRFEHEGEVLCTASSTRALDPAECEDVACTWTAPDFFPTPITIDVRVDPDDALAECVEENNAGTIEGVICAGV